MTQELKHLGRILLAEDNPGDVYLLRESFAENGIECELEVAKDGEEIVDRLKQLDSPESVNLRLIVLDLNLPKLHGLEVLESVRQNPALSGIPVVVLTSSVSKREQRRAEDLGARMYITKPSNFEDYMAVGKIVRGLLPD